MRSFLLFSLLILSVTFSFSQDRKLKAYLDEKQYFNPEIGNYLEVQLQFIGYSINYKGVSGGLQGEVSVFMEFKQGDSVVTSDGFRLQTPLMKDSIVEDFYDIRRFALKPGNYQFTIELKDLLGKEKAQTATKTIQIEDWNQKIEISDIEIAETVTRGNENSPFFKSGYDVLPKISNYFPEELVAMPVYFEVYNTQQLQHDVFAIRQKITNVITGIEIPAFTQTSRHKPGEIVPYLKSIDIRELPSGKYTLQYSVISKEMTELAIKTYEFERSNTIDNFTNAEQIVLDPAFQESIHKDSVQYYLASMIPIANPAEIRNILDVIKSKNDEQARKLIQGFWSHTAPQNPYEAWIKYKIQVQYVERLYKNNFQAGYETDRGRVYLQYGPPSMITSREFTGNEYPYEIWQYDKIGKYSNRRFIFYNPDLLPTSYRLLHSDVIGEIKNPAWQQVLNSRNTPNGNVDDPNGNVQQNFGNSNYYFKQY